MAYAETANMCAVEPFTAHDFLGRTVRPTDLGRAFMKHTKPREKSPVTWIVVTVLLLSAIGAALWVPLYARSGPKLGAFPFFYWYQLVLVPVVAIASWVSYLLLRPARSNQSANPPASSRDPSLARREETR
jgi:hypothetical protein